MIRIKKLLIIKKSILNITDGKSGKKIEKKKKSNGDKGKVDSPPAMKAMKKSVPAKDEKKTHKKKDGKKTQKKKEYNHNISR